MSKYSYDRRVVVQARTVHTGSLLRLSPGREDNKATESLQKVKLYAKNRGDMNSAVISAGFYAKKLGKVMFGYSGNSFGHLLWRVTYKPSEYLSPISNTGGKIFSVTPDLVFSWYDVHRADNTHDSTE